MRIQVNGEESTRTVPCTIGTLLDERGLPRVKVAVEWNGRVLRRSEHDETWLQEGDVIEIVTLVGGG
jgi:sulfur carrier protein